MKVKWNHENKVCQNPARQLSLSKSWTGLIIPFFFPGHGMAESPTLVSSKTIIAASRKAHTWHNLRCHASIVETLRNDAMSSHSHFFLLLELPMVPPPLQIKKGTAHCQKKNSVMWGWFEVPTQRRHLFRVYKRNKPMPCPADQSWWVSS